MSCAAVPGTIIVTTAVVPIVTGTTRITGTIMLDFVAPVLDLAGIVPQNAGVSFFMEKGSVQSIESRPGSCVGCQKADEQMKKPLLRC